MRKHQTLIWKNIETEKWERLCEIAAAVAMELPCAFHTMLSKKNTHAQTGVLRASISLHREKSNPIKSYARRGSHFECRNFLSFSRFLRWFRVCFRYAITHAYIHSIHTHTAITIELPWQGKQQNRIRNYSDVCVSYFESISQHSTAVWNFPTYERQKQHNRCVLVSFKQFQWRSILSTTERNTNTYNGAKRPDQRNNKWKWSVCVAEWGKPKCMIITVFGRSTVLISVDAKRKATDTTQIHHTNYIYIHFNGVDWSSPIIIPGEKECVFLSSWLSPSSSLSFCISFITFTYIKERARTLTIRLHFRFLFGISLYRIQSKCNLVVTSIQSYFRNNLIYCVHAHSRRKKKRNETKRREIKKHVTYTSELFAAFSLFALGLHRPPIFS